MSVAMSTIPESSRTSQILKKKGNPRKPKITYSKFARVFAEYLGRDFDKEKANHFGPDHKVSDYMTCGLDWRDFADECEEKFNLQLMNTKDWDELGGDPGISSGVDPDLTMFKVFEFVTKHKCKVGASLRKIQPDELRILVRGYVSHYVAWTKGNEELLPDSYRVKFPWLSQFNLHEDLMRLARRYDFSIDFDALYDLFENSHVVVDDIIRFMIAAEEKNKLTPQLKESKLRAYATHIFQKHSEVAGGQRFLSSSPLVQCWLFIELDTLANELNFEICIDQFFEMCEYLTTYDAYMAFIEDSYTRDI